MRTSRTRGYQVQHPYAMRSALVADPTIRLYALEALLREAEFSDPGGDCSEQELKQLIDQLEADAEAREEARAKTNEEEG